MTGCRIGKIKLRNGAEVRVLDTHTSQCVELCRESFVEDANYTMAAEQNMRGYFMVAWGGDTVTDHCRVFEGSKRGIFDIPEFVKSVATQRIASKLSEGTHRADDPEAG